MLTFYCPQCWQTIGEESTQCPSCGYLLADYHALSYEDKLLRAIWHPVAERRLMAIRILGEMRSQKALPDFDMMIRNETLQEYFLLSELLNAVGKIGGPYSLEILKAATTHPSLLVRRMAQEILRSAANLS